MPSFCEGYNQFGGHKNNNQFNNTKKQIKMEKVIRCRDVGFDCDGVIKAKTEDEALQLAAEHAKTVHGLEEVTPDVVEQIKSVMTEE